MLFAANCGNIIRRYCFAAEYALVAQPVEHLTFNQRARDSSSLERTKNPTKNRKIPRGIFHFLGLCTLLHTFLHTGGKAVFFLALSAFCASWRNLSGQGPSILLRKTAPSLKPHWGFHCCAALANANFPYFFQANSRRVNSRRCSGFICRTTFSIPSGVIWMLSGRFSFTGTEPDLGEPMSCE